MQRSNDNSKHFLGAFVQGYFAEIIIFKKCLFIYVLRERESERIHAPSVEPDAGLNLTDREIMTLNQGTAEPTRHR